MYRLVGFRWRPGHFEGRKAAEAHAARVLGRGNWRQVLSTRGFLLLAAETSGDVAALVLPNGMGFVVGALFTGEGSDYARVLDTDLETCRAWAETDGATLAQTCWGGYLAIVVDNARDRILIMREPMGGRPCFVREALSDGVRILFTDFEDVAEWSPLQNIDEEFLRLFLAQPRIVHERTGIRGVREVLAGECYALGAEGDCASLFWRPPARRVELAAAEAKDLARDLRSHVLGACRAWTSLNRPILHRLSGGLDSSIALAALSKAGGDIVCVNEWPRGYAEGDEREAARAVASKFAAKLVELEYEPREIDYRKLMEAPLSAKPSIATLSFADPHFHDLAEAGALLTSGQGGDQVFYRSRAACTIADAVRDRLQPATIISLALDAARVSRRSVWPGLAIGAQYGVLWPPRAYLRNLLIDAAGLSGPHAAIAAADAALEDPWVKDALARGPGEAMRALLISDLQYYHGPSLLNRSFIPAPVITSQPIVEFCCSIPTYRSFDGGRDRALARLAFANDLPASSVARQRKGDTTRFFGAVAAANGDFIIDALKGGELVKRGLFDAARLDAKSRRAVLDFSNELVAELWLRQIKARHAEQGGTQAIASA
ncbi:MAG: asparagine synthase-related protein [Terricaulis sp.]